jgi:hypothetical protein
LSRQESSPPAIDATGSEQLNRTESLLTTEAIEEYMSLLVSESTMFICGKNPAILINQFDVNNSVQ